MKKSYFVVAATFALTLVAPSAALASEGAQAMWRLYNPYTGEHFYTASESERDAGASAGWRYEGLGWVAPRSSGTPVYRLYNPYAPGGDHHYTMSASERDSLVAAGWRYEGVGWYSDDEMSVPLYRQYNPYAATGSHNYTASAAERDSLVSLGWRDEGVAWYGLAHQHTWVAITHEEPVFGTEPTYGQKWVQDSAAYDERVCTGSHYLFSDGHVEYDYSAAMDYMYSTGCSYSGVDDYKTVHHDATGHYETVQTGTKQVQTGTRTVTDGYRCSTCGAAK